VEGVPTFIEWFMALIRVHSLEVPPTHEPQIVSGQWAEMLFHVFRFFRGP
jgi:hypothetical protein